MDQDFRVFLVGFGSNTAVDHHLAYWPQAENVPEKHLKSMEPQREAWLTFPSSFRRSCAQSQGYRLYFLTSVWVQLTRDELQRHTELTGVETIPTSGWG